MENEKPQPANLPAQADHFIDDATGAVTPPVITATTYARDGAYLPRGPVLKCSRDGNPNYPQAEEIIAKLEGGAKALLFASGLAPATSLFKGLSNGNHVVIPSLMYYMLRVWVKAFAEPRATVEGPENPVPENILRITV